MKQLKVLDLFSGTQSIAREFRKRGHLTYTVELDKEHEGIDWYANVMEITAQDIIDRFGHPDVIWASPPCEKFSVASIGRYWEKGSNVPATEESKKALELLEHTVKLIKELNPTYYFIENPRGKMRKMDCMQELHRYTVTYCQYGDTRMKPTDLWTNHPEPNFKPPCKNGDSCHVSAPRGSRTGTQGLKGAKERSVIPSQLCEYVSKISEQGFENIIDLEYIVNELIHIAINSTSEGNWIFDVENVEKLFNVKLTEDILKEIEDILWTREEIADVQIYNNEIDIMLWLKYIETEEE